MSRRVVITLAAALLLPATAGAHLVNTGVGPFYDGMAHVFLSTEDLLVVVALALLGGLAGQAHARRAVLVLPAAWLAGGVSGLYWGAVTLPVVATSVTFLAAGGLVALDRWHRQALVLGAAAVVGLLHGYANGTALLAASAGLAELVGILAAVFAISTLLAALAMTLRTTSARVVVRVLGSWITATGVLMIGWAWSGMPV